MGQIFWVLSHCGTGLISRSSITPEEFSRVAFIEEWDIQGRKIIREVNPSLVPKFPQQEPKEE